MTPTPKSRKVGVIFRNMARKGSFIHFPNPIITIHYRLNGFMLNALGSNPKDSSPTIDPNWTLLCSDAQNLSILNYQHTINDLANYTIPLITLVLSAMGIFVNVIFSILVLFGLKTDILPIKGYSLLLSRSLTDLFVVVVTTVFIAFRQLDETNLMLPGNSTDLNPSVMEYAIPHGRTVFTLLLTVDYWAVSGAYGIMAVLPFLAVRYPIFYRTQVTKYRIVTILVVSWLVGALYSALVVALSANNAFNVFNSASDLIQWTVSNEDYVLSISNLLIVGIAFIIGSCGYISVIFYLHKKRHSHNTTAYLNQIVRLALNIGAFAVTCVIMASFVSLPLFLRSHINELQTDVVQDVCKTVVEIFQLSYMMTIWTTAAMAGWMGRITLDPITNMFIDSRFREVVHHITHTKIQQVNFKIYTLDADALNKFLKKCSKHNVIPTSVLNPNRHYIRWKVNGQIPDQPIIPRKRNTIIHIRFDDMII